MCFMMFRREIKQPKQNPIQPLKTLIINLGGKLWRRKKHYCNHKSTHQPFMCQIINCLSQSSDVDFLWSIKNHRNIQGDTCILETFPKQSAENTNRDIPQQIIKVNNNLKTGQVIMEKVTFFSQMLFCFFFFPNPHWRVMVHLSLRCPTGARKTKLSLRRHFI